MKESLLAMHYHIRHQQQKLETQMVLLLNTRQGGETICTELTYGDICPTPRTMAELRIQTQQRHHSISRDVSQLLLPSEKESASAVFLKYSQLLLKWSEMELAVIKELCRVDGNASSTHDIEKNMPEEDIEIVRHYLQLSNKDTVSS